MPSPIQTAKPTRRDNRRPFKCASVPADFFKNSCVTFVLSGLPAAGVTVAAWPLAPTVAAVAVVPWRFGHAGQYCNSAARRLRP